MNVLTTELSKPLDISLKRGDTLFFTITSLVEGEPEDFTGSTLEMMVKDEKDVLLIDITPFIVFEENIISVDVPAEVTATFRPGTYLYDLRQLVGSLTFTRLEGYFIVKKDITF